MFNVFRRVSNFLTTDHVKRAEMNYLNGSHDRVDLEYRMREIDSGKFRKGRNSFQSFY